MDTGICFNTMCTIKFLRLFIIINKDGWFVKMRFFYRYSSQVCEQTYYIQLYKNTSFPRQNICKCKRTYTRYIPVYVPFILC